MPVTFTQTTTKPEGAKFFAQVSDENKVKASSFWKWTESFPGFLSQNLDYVSPNERVQTVVFDTVENYAAWAAARLTHPDHNEKAAYNLDNGITFSNNETIS